MKNCILILLIMFSFNVSANLRCTEDTQYFLSNENVNIVLSSGEFSIIPTVSDGTLVFLNGIKISESSQVLNSIRFKFVEQGVYSLKTIYKYRDATDHYYHQWEYICNKQVIVNNKTIPTVSLVTPDTTATINLNEYQTIKFSASDAGVNLHRYGAISLAA